MRAEFVGTPPVYFVRIFQVLPASIQYPVRYSNGHDVRQLPPSDSVTDFFKPPEHLISLLF